MNTFRHIFGQALLTGVFGEGFARFVGDAHERDPNGLVGTGPIDSQADLINNTYGRQLGARLAGKYDFTQQMTARQVAAFVTEVSDYVINSFSDLRGGRLVFSEKSTAIINLTNAINTAISNE